MTKTELLEQILAELKAIHAALETPADLPTPADDYEGMTEVTSGKYYYDTAHLRPQSPANAKYWHEKAKQNGWSKNTKLPDYDDPIDLDDAVAELQKIAGAY